MWWKMGQWIFLMETRCHLETIEVPNSGAVGPQFKPRLCHYFFTICVYMLT